MTVNGLWLYAHAGVLVLLALQMFAVIGLLRDINRATNENNMWLRSINQYLHRMEQHEMLGTQQSNRSKRRPRE